MTSLDVFVFIIGIKSLENLDQAPKVQLENAFKIAPQLQEVYLIRGELKDIFEQAKNKEEATQAVEKWEEKLKK